MNRRARIFGDVQSGVLADDDPDWQPATSQPGELYTPEGEFRQRGHLLRIPAEQLRRAR